MEQPGETHSRFAIQHGEKKKNRQGINQTEQTLGQASQRAANPYTQKPPTASAPPLVTVNATKNCTGEESAEQRFGHENTPEHCGAPATKINQTRKESSPVVR